MYYRISWLGADGKRYSADYETEKEALSDWETIQSNGGKHLKIEQIEGELRAA